MRAHSKGNPKEKGATMGLSIVHSCFTIMFKLEHMLEKP
jgi:hypothetical protein